MSGVLIIGTGLAGYTVAREFRKLDTSTPVTLLTRDDGSFYSKPVLSNALAQKKVPSQIALNSAADMTRQLQAAIHTHLAVRSLEPNRREIEAENGMTFAYDKLVLAIGADPIRVPMAGNGTTDVLSINDLDDYSRFRAQLDGRARVLILGAGLIGCEFANDLNSIGVGVDVVDPAPQLLGRLLPPPSAAFLRQALESRGIRFHLGATAANIDQAANGYRVMLNSGTTIETDLVLSAIGLRARTALAASAGLNVNRGIVTDRLLNTSQPDIYALGDCAEVNGFHLPFVMPIMQAARALAKTLSGSPTEVQYPAMPVVVKTPACPTVVCPPPPGAPGEWSSEVSETGVRAVFHDHSGRATGFALTGSAVADKQALAKEMPALF